MAVNMFLRPEEEERLLQDLANELFPEGVDNVPAATPESATVESWPIPDVELLNSNNSMSEPGPIKVKRQRRKRKSSVLAGQSCPVCGTEGTGDKSAFGGRSCNSCRAFFRRAVIGGRAKCFTCNTETCSINSKSWKSCQRCRFKRCLELAGMKEELAMGSGNDEKCRVVAVNPHDHESFNKLSHIIPTGPKDRFTLEETLFITGLRTFTTEKFVKAFLSVIKSNTDILMDTISGYLYGEKFRWDYTVQLTKAVRKNSLQFYEQLSDLQDLDPDDRKAIMSTNSRRMHELIQSVQFDSQYNTTSNVRKMINYVYFREQQYRSVLEALGITPAMVLKPLRYHQLYHEDCHMDQKSYNRHRSLLLTLSKCGSKDPASPDRMEDEIHTTLLGLILLFSSKGLVLKNPHAVMCVQRKYSRMLFNYLRQEYPESAQERFDESMQADELTREAIDLKNLFL